MDEAAWLTATDPTPMLAFLRNAEKASERKLRLFAGACCRRILRLVGSSHRDLGEVTERYADGLATPEEPLAARDEAHDPDWTAGLAFEEASCTEDVSEAAAYAAGNAAHAAADAAADYPADAEADPTFLTARDDERRVQAALLRDIFGNPFRATRIDASVLRWNDGCVVRIAEGIYQERAFDRMGVLHDALLDAGCDAADVLSHAHDGESHARGCWLLDLLLNKE